MASARETDRQTDRLGGPSRREYHSLSLALVLYHINRQTLNTYIGNMTEGSNYDYLFKVRALNHNACGHNQLPYKRLTGVSRRCALAMNPGGTHWRFGRRKIVSPSIRG